MLNEFATNQLLERKIIEVLLSSSELAIIAMLLILPTV